MMAFEPRRDIDQPGKAGGMAFGKAIAAEPLDLGKAAGGKIGLIAAFKHARDEPIAKATDGAHAFEGGQGPSQPVSLSRGKACGHHGDLHGLFLEQGHAIGAAQDLHHGGAQIFYRFLALTAVDEGMHHAALNGAGSHNGNLADQIVELARPHAGQKVKLRPAFHLKDPNRIGTAQHVIDLRILGWDIGERQTKAAMLRQKVKRLADAGQHPQREDIHLEKPQRVDVVLVPFDDSAILHRSVLDGAKLIQPPLGDDKAADMLRQVAGKADDVADQLQGQHHAAVGRIKPRVTDPVCRGGG